MITCAACGKEIPPRESLSNKRGRDKVCDRECAARLSTKRANERAWTRYWSCVHKRGADDCWEWLGYRNRAGYGVFSFAKSRVLAHRAMFALCEEPIPDGLHVLHRCDNPPCCNPRHLWLGTDRDNVRDCISKGRAVRNPRRGEEQYIHKLTDNAVVEILRSTEPTRLLAEKYRVDYQTIWKVRNGLTWKHIPRGAQ